MTTSKGKIYVKNGQTAPQYVYQFPELCSQEVMDERGLTYDMCVQRISGAEYSNILLELNYDDHIPMVTCYVVYQIRKNSWSK